MDTVPPAITLATPTNAAIIAGNLVISGTATDNIAVADSRSPPRQRCLDSRDRHDHAGATA